LTPPRVADRQETEVLRAKAPRPRSKTKIRSRRRVPIACRSVAGAASAAGELLAREHSAARMYYGELQERLTIGYYQDEAEEAEWPYRPQLWPCRSSRSACS
jgi:hypothetical protein